MQSQRKPLFAWFLIVPAAAWLGCQKSSESPPPPNAVANSNGAKAPPQGDSTVEAPRSPSEQNFQHPQFALETTAGKIVVRLDAEKAPLTVDNFRNYVAHRHYDKTIFHQVYKAPVQIVLGGVYTADLKAKPARTPIRNEADNGLKNHRGTIAMARGADEDSATCQFYFNLADNDSLNFKKPTRDGYGYCVFGEVTEGMEILDRIGSGALHDSGKITNTPVEAVAIKSVRQIK